MSVRSATPEEDALNARRRLLQSDAQNTEKHIRTFGEFLVNEYEVMGSIVQTRNITWLAFRNRGYASVGMGGTIGPPDPCHTLTLHIPGSDFAAQLVVEQQIRDQLAQHSAADEPKAR